MKFPFQRPGAVFSGLAHAGLFGFILFNLSLCSVDLPVDDVKEAVPIDTISTDAFNKIMAGEKSSKDVTKDQATRADKVAQEVDQHPPTPEPKKAETPPPPPPPAPTPPVPTPPVQPTPPTPPPPPAPEPPVRPDPTPPPPLPPVVPPPTPTPPAPTPPERDPDAEVIKPAPPKRPDPPKPVPEPPDLPKRADVKPPPKPVKLPPTKPAKPQPDQIAKLSEETPDPKPVHRPAARATPAPPTDRTFDPTDISKILNADAPSGAISTGSKLSKVASRGAASGHDTQMSPNLWDALDGLMQDQYKQCWSYLGLTQTKYIPQIKVVYDSDGSLASEPVLINKPSDPALRSLAESALRAVKQCNPLKIPPQYAPYYDEWRARVLRFDPAEMSG